MKRIFFVVVLFLVAGMFVAVSGRAGFNYQKSLTSTMARLLPTGATQLHSQTQSTSYTSTLTGDEINAGRPDVITFAADATAAEGQTGLPGHITVTIRFNRATNAVIGGDWVFTVIQPETGEGTMHGTIANGSMTINEAGKVTAVAGVELIVTGGNGSYESLNSGRGSFEGTLSERPASGQVQPIPSPNGGSSTASPTAPPPPSVNPADDRNMPPFTGTLRLTF